MTSPRARTLARLAATLLVLAATLPPQAPAGLADVSRLCLLCGHAGASGFLLNVVLFVPLGVAVARSDAGLRGAAAALIVGLLLSGGVEVAQTQIPGRHTALGDLAANAAGAGLGGLLAVTAGAWLRPRPDVAGALSLAWGGAVAAVVLGTALLLAPSLPRSVYWVQQAPELGQFERFPGEVLEARAGGLRLAPGPMSTADRRALVGALLGGPRLEATARFGPPTRGLAPVLSVFDGRQREIFVLGQDGDGLVFRMRRRADRARFHRPELRAPGLLARMPVGDTVTLRVRPTDALRRAGARSVAGGRAGSGASEGRDAEAHATAGESGLCLEAGDRRRCGLGHRAGRGWALLLGPGPAADLARGAEAVVEAGAPSADSVGRALDAAWVALLFLPLGFWARPRRGWRLGLVLAGAGLLAAPAAGPLLPAGAAEAAGVAVGLIAGVAGRGLVGGADAPRAEAVHGDADG